jgi:hypothetical protein
LKNADYQGSEIVIGEGPTCRWATWVCSPTSAASSPVRAVIAGRKDRNPIAALLGRMRLLEESPDRATAMRLMWRTFVTGPIDPVCDTEYRSTP